MPSRHSPAHAEPSARSGAGSSRQSLITAVLCIAGTIALAAALPRFLRYDGTDGMARKQAEDEAWAARAST